MKLPRVLLGVFLIVFGALALAQYQFNLNLGDSLWTWMMALMFGLGGVAFLSVLWRDRRQWWAAIPGFTLVGLGALIGLSSVLKDDNNIPPALFMASIGLSFLVVYLLNRDNWWAIIPCGALFTVALIVLLSNRVDSIWVPAVLFGGLAATFGVLSLIPGEGGKRMTWPWIPAVALLGVGLMVLTFGGPVPEVVWAVALILAGGLLVGRALMKR